MEFITLWVAGDESTSVTEDGRSGPVRLRETCLWGGSPPTNQSNSLLKGILCTGGGTRNLVTPPRPGREIILFTLMSSFIVLTRDVSFPIVR